MKKEKVRRARAKPQEVLSLPPAARIAASQGAPFLQSLSWSGKFQGEGTVAFRVVLPCLSHGESMAFLEAVRDAALGFWKKESEKARGEVWFGGMEVLWKGDHLELFACFAPFSAREYAVRAVIVLTKEGAIDRILPSLKIRKRERPKWRSLRSR